MCKLTKNNKKLSTVVFILMKNLVNRIGINLGIRAIKKLNEEKLYQYMNIINKVLIENIKITLFKEKFIKTVEIYEKIFLRNKGVLSLNQISDMFEIYYEIRKLKIPNIYIEINEEDTSFSTNFGLFSALSGNKKKKYSPDDKFKYILLKTIDEEEKDNLMKLKTGFNETYFKNAFYLKNMKDLIRNKDKKKVLLQGSLQKSINYKQTLENTIGYMFLGGCILCFLLGIAIMIENIIFPELTMIFGVLSLAFLGIAGLFFIVYYYNFYTRN